MTKVFFYSNLTNIPLAIVALAEQAVVKRQMVTVMMESEQQAQACSNNLWHHDNTSFIPNALMTDDLVDKTPVVLSWQENQLCQDDILINLSQKQLTVFSRFRQLIELVGTDESDKVLARQRYKFYRDRGYEIIHLEEKDLIH